MEERVELDVCLICNNPETAKLINEKCAQKGIYYTRTLDGKYNYYYLVDKEKKRLKNLYSDRVLKSCIRESMTRWGFDEVLLGSQAIKHMIYHTLDDPRFFCSAKELINVSCEKMDMSFSQVERCLRYSIGKSVLHGKRLKIVEIVRLLGDDVRATLRRRKRENS